MKRGEEGKRAHKDRMDALREKTHKKIDYHLQKAVIEPGDFYHLISGFFLDLLEKEYEPTYEDILEELEEIEHDYLLFTDKQRARAEKLLHELSEIEYTGRDVTQEEARRILQEFRNLAAEFTSFEEESIEHALHEGGVALKNGDAGKAQEAYQRAHQLYQKLGDAQKKHYFSELRELYAKLQQA